MFRTSFLLSLLAMFLVGCGQAAASACPSDDQNACVDTTLSYDGGIGSLINARCSPCHASGGVEATVLLTDYSHVAAERMTIASQLITCAMPPAGAPDLSADERSQILDWLSCGGPK
jgi:uncharacterized membrane protein